jgi:HmuY protein
MKWTIYSVLVFFMMTMVSCFEEDQAVPAYALPANVDTISIQKSIYEYQMYFDFSTGSVVSENENSEWILSFESADSGYHIRINSSDFWGLAPTGSDNMDSVFAQSPDYIWKHDTSDGNPDSTAVGSWVTFKDGVPAYSKEVYLLGKYDGIAYNLAKKVQFISVDEERYRFLISDPELSDPDTIDLIKDNRYSYTQFSAEDKSSIQLEPEKENWDILFEQYFTILYTDDGIPAPYYVRGVLLNPYQVEAALDTTIHFLDVTYSIALQNEFSSVQDYIGHDWKSVTVDEASNSAEYKVRPGYTYIVRDADNVLYKFRFKSYFNKSGVKGYPSLEYAKLSPE